MREPPPLSWHAMALDDVRRAVDAGAGGLTADEARRRLARTGSNQLPAPPRVSWMHVLGAQLRSVIVALLVVACAVAAVTADLADAVAIAAVLALNVTLGFVVEIRAHRAVEGLRRLEARQATVLRDGAVAAIDARELVPGDVVLVETGAAVPADARLLAAVELCLVESALTGESLPVAKDAEAAVDARAPLPDRTNMIHAGTTVAAGSGRALVVATGTSTELGNIGRLVAATAEEPTPLERRLAVLGRHLVWAALLIGVVTSLLAWSQGAPPGLILQAGIALAVAAVPEGLPAVATIVLALGVRRMAKRHALVRRLPSVETLGAVTVICTDKTGTLTAGTMQVTAIRTALRDYDVTGSGYAPDGSFLIDAQAVSPASDPDLEALLRAAVMANRSDAVRTAGGWVARGDPTEAALIVAARKAGIERAPLVAALPERGEVPFSAERRLMATFHAGADGGTLVFVKGAPQRVLASCSRMLAEGSERPLQPSDLRTFEESNRALAARGLRVLAMAYGQAAAADESALANLTFAGMAGMHDPPAAGVPEAIRAFRAAGVRTVMVTGDQRGTALAIARELGLAAEGAAALDGRDVDALGDEALAERLREVTVFSRISPEGKLRIVAALQRDGEIVAMLGDGVNDAAALKKADVGVTMGGRGTDVAREAAAVVLQDDRFETIGVAIEEGRVIFDNIRKFVFYLFSCNLAEVLVLVGASAAGYPLPLAPIQILWLNLVTDTVPALALAAEPGGAEVMRRPPRDPRREILSGGFLRSIAGYGLLLAAPVFAVMAWSRWTLMPAGRAVTMNFMVLSLAQLFHLGNARDDRAVVRPRLALANTIAVAALVVSIAVQLLAVFWEPLRELLRLQLLTRSDWIVVIAAGGAPAVVGQAVKIVRRGL